VDLIYQTCLLFALICCRYIEEPGVVGGVPMDQSESDAILAYLYAQANHPEYALALGYNMRTMHVPSFMSVWFSAQSFGIFYPHPLERFESLKQFLRRISGKTGRGPTRGNSNFRSL
jgi:hypothetical protein